MNHEDSIVVSESALNKMRSTKSETILIPIYEYSMFRTVYPNSPYKFLPMVGQSVNDNIVTFDDDGINSIEHDKMYLLKVGTRLQYVRLNVFQ